MGALRRLSHIGVILLSFVILIVLSTYFQHSQSKNTTHLVARGSVDPIFDLEPAHAVHRHYHKRHIHPRQSSDVAVIDTPDDLPSSNDSLLMRRDDYSCGPGNPCPNRACCGASGYCGYGKTYCGDGCISNCEAVAECGKDATPSGKKCPLNTCCSQYGFCGTTEVSNPSKLASPDINMSQDFCTEKCQSNCVLHPKPPASAPNQALKKGNVIPRSRRSIA